ncbi:MAG: hypothetical protein JSW68_07110, partial [Burkholderiales bacterium]
LCATPDPSRAAQPDPCAAPAAHALRAQGASISAVLTPEPAPIRVTEPFALSIAFCPPQAAAAVERIEVDASMPMHRHGMNYRASIRRDGIGRYRADGLLLHMPGLWRFELVLHAGGVREPLSAELELR